MYTDTLSDLTTRLRNASAAGRTSLEVKYSKSVDSIVNILKKEGYISSATAEGRVMNIELNPDMPLTHIERLSKPGLRRYVKSTNIPKTKSGFGLIILTTPKGMLTDNQAKKQKVGGELICEVW